MRHLLKSLVMTLVVTAGALMALAILLNFSFFDAWVNTITFWCIIALMACIWVAFAAEILETVRAQKQRKTRDETVEKLLDAAALNEADDEDAPPPPAEDAPAEAEPPAPLAEEPAPAPAAPEPRKKAAPSAAKKRPPARK